MSVAMINLAIKFQSTPSVGRATLTPPEKASTLSDFNPRPPWGGRPRRAYRDNCHHEISIHALRGEGDRLKRVGCDEDISFQSTPSVGRATLQIEYSESRLDISIHALRGEGDCAAVRCGGATVAFQSTPSVGRATRAENILLCHASISIHALRGEGDKGVCARRAAEAAFQSTPSVGRATWTSFHKCARSSFQSTPSVGRATEDYEYSIWRRFISIHALRGEGDSKNIQIYNIVFVHSAYKIIYFCDSCAFYLT